MVTLACVRVASESCNRTNSPALGHLDRGPDPECVRALEYLFSDLSGECFGCYSWGG